MLQYVTPETLTIVWSQREGLGGLLVLETLTINELYQCHPPSPLIFIGSADLVFRTI